MAAELTHPVPGGWVPERYVAFLRAGADLLEQKAAREVLRRKKRAYQEKAAQLRADAAAIEAKLQEKDDAADG